MGNPPARCARYYRAHLVHFEWRRPAILYYGENTLNSNEHYRALIGTLVTGITAISPELVQCKKYRLTVIEAVCRYRLSRRDTPPEHSGRARSVFTVASKRGRREAMPEVALPDDSVPCLPAAMDFWDGHPRPVEQNWSVHCNADPDRSSLRSNPPPKLTTLSRWPTRISTRRSFEVQLPNCLITLQRNKKSYGYFCGDRFGRADGTLTDEIALNPSLFPGPATGRSARHPRP